MYLKLFYLINLINLFLIKNILNIKMKDIWEKYEKMEIIGAGGFGDVYRGKNIETNEYVAIKEIKK